MKKMLNSPKALIAVTIAFIGVIANRNEINSAIEKAIANLLPKENYAQQWQVKPGSIYDGDTLRVVRGTEELEVRFCGIDAPEIKQPLGIESRDYLRSLIAKGEVVLAETNS